jgi:hypothetical protein
MILFPRFIYEDGAGAEGAGGNGDGDNKGGEGGVAAPVGVTMSEADVQELQSLRAFKASIAEKEPEKTPEEIAKQAEKEKGEFIKYSSDEGLMKVDEFHAYENLKVKADRDLVFESWFTNWKEENPDIEADEIEARAKADFEDEYKLSSTNDKTKARGEARLAREAAEVRKPLQTTYEKAQGAFKELQSIRQTYPKYEKFMDDLIKETVPEQIVFKTKEGEEDITIDDVKLTDEDKKEIAKQFKNDKNFFAFTKNADKLDTVKAAIAKKIDGYLKVKYFDKVNEAVYAAAKGIGVKKGSNVGAEAPFAIVRGGQLPGGESKVSGQKEVEDNDFALRQKVNANR